MKQETEKAPSRRAFLKLAGTAAPAALAAATLTPNTGEANEVNTASSTMQDTAHTRAYLASARF